jgi:hypothetical protein
MTNSLFDPNDPLFPWYKPPTAPGPTTPSLADLVRPAPELDPNLLAGLSWPVSKPDSSLLARLLKPPRSRIFVSYQHSSDQYYYNLFSQTLHDTYETIYDDSLREEVDSQDSEYIIQRIRDEFITGSSCTIVLVGPTSYQRKYMDWEIKATLDKKHGLIGIQLPNLIPTLNGGVRVPDRLNENIRSGYALWQGFTWQSVISNPATLPQLIQAAVSRSTSLILNRKEIKKQNG